MLGLVPQPNKCQFNTFPKHGNFGVDLGVHTTLFEIRDPDKKIVKKIYTQSSKVT